MELFASSTQLLIVNLLFAATALSVGFAAGAWFFGGAEASSDKSGLTGVGGEPSAEQIDRERTAMASDRLRDLVSHVASDVGEHNASIDEIGAALKASTGAGGDSLAAAVTDAVDKIQAANAELQQKLEKAEQQIESQAAEIRAHESEARTDSLTKIANRRAFDQELRRRLAEWCRNETPVSLLIMDVDHFKKFNDTHGHQAGDEVLRKVGAALTGCAREVDLPCRYGGEEFAVVLPATRGEDGSIAAERVRKAIEGLSIEFEGKTLNVTVSLGLAQAEPDEEPNHLIKRADEALYQSKDAGRNNAHLHDGERCVPITPGMTAPAAPQEPATPAPALAPVDQLPNRTRFVEELRGAIRHREETGAPLSVLIAELECRDRLAAEFGAEVAQLTFESVGQFIENALRDGDTLGQLEGGRFVILMPESDAATAEQFGERVRAALAGCTVPLGDEQLQLQTRMSAAAYEPGDTEVTLMRRVEAGMDLLAEVGGGATLV